MPFRVTIAPFVQVPGALPPGYQVGSTHFKNKKPDETSSRPAFEKTRDCTFRARHDRYQCSIFCMVIVVVGELPAVRL